MADARKSCTPPTRRQLAVEDLRLPLVLTASGIESIPMGARVSGGTVTLRAALAWSPGPRLELRDLKVTGVDLKPVLVDYLCFGYAVTGPLELAGDTSLRPDDPWRTLNGAGRFRIGPGKVVGSGILELMNDAMRVRGALAALATDGQPWTAAAPPDFDSITGTYRITNGVLTTNDLVYSGRSSRVTAAGAYRLSDGLMDMAVAVDQGRAQMRARVAGPPGSVRVIPTGVTPGDPVEVRRLLDRVLR
jgi:hypothetical protein